MTAPAPAPDRWLPGLVDLVRRRPELADIGLGRLVREVRS